MPVGRIQAIVATGNAIRNYSDDPYNDWSMASEWLPEEVFAAMAYAVTSLARTVDKECGISLGSWLCLYYLKRDGKQSEYGQIMLRSTLTRTLEERAFTPPHIAKLLRVLADKHLIVRPILTAAERRALFGSADGSLMAVAITPSGEAKIQEFKEVLRTRFEKWRGQQDAPLRAAINILRGAAKKVGKLVITRPGPQNARRRPQVSEHQQAPADAS